MSFMTAFDMFPESMISLDHIVKKPKKKTPKFVYVIMETYYDDWKLLGFCETKKDALKFVQKYNNKLKVEPEKGRFTSKKYVHWVKIYGNINNNFDKIYQDAIEQMHYEEDLMEQFYDRDFDGSEDK